MLFRQGDIFIQSCAGLPSNTFIQKSLVLVAGERTGHSHRIETPNTAEVYRHFSSDSLYINVTAAVVNIVHHEHETITLTPGIYRVWRQREFGEEGNRIVRD